MTTTRILPLPTSARFALSDAETQSDATEVFDAAYFAALDAHDAAESASWD